MKKEMNESFKKVSVKVETIKKNQITKEGMNFSSSKCTGVEITTHGNARFFFAMNGGKISAEVSIPLLAKLLDGSKKDAKEFLLNPSKLNFRCLLSIKIASGKKGIWGRLMALQRLDEDMFRFYYASHTKGEDILVTMPRKLLRGEVKGLRPNF